VVHVVPFGKDIVPVDQVSPGVAAYHPPPTLGGSPPD
jgi:hypothetical protein